MYFLTKMKVNEKLIKILQVNNGLIYLEFFKMIFQITPELKTNQKGNYKTFQTEFQ